jgi:hypothetical protein
MRWNHYVSYFFLRSLSHKCDPAFCERHYRTPFPKPFCLSPGARALFRRGECALGRTQPCYRLLARMPRWTI